MGRVCIGTCQGPADAAFVRSAFEAHQIRFFINAEQHASMLGGLGGALVPLRIYVAEEDAEEAAALLADLRDGPDLEDEVDDEPPDREDVPVETRIANRRHTGVVLLLAICVSFGTASMYLGAWRRGVAIAVAEILTLAYALRTTLGAPLLGACVAVDLVSCLWQISRRRGAIALPEARLRRRGG
jgi:hypothetical protein